MISLVERGIRAVLLDIEGTTTPIAFVHDVLFPYARARLREYVDAGTASRMERLMDADSKDGELKELQGRIWDRGYVEGSLRSVVYPDVLPALKRWRLSGVRVAIYSSGSVRAQRLLFANSDQGDLTNQIDSYFDTQVGAKKVAASYARISQQLRLRPVDILFVSDVPAELDAANDAGLQTALAVRPGNAPDATSPHPRVRTFAEITP